MSYHQVEAVLDAQFPDMPAALPGRRRAVGRHALKLVCLAFAAPTDCDGTDAHPGLRRAARRASVSIDTARCAVHALVELGVLVLAIPSDGRRPDQYNLSAAGLAGLVDRPSARATRALPTAGHPRASARARPVHTARVWPARDSPEVHKSNNDVVPTSPVRLVAETPSDLAKQRVAAIIAEHAEHSMRPDLFGTRYRDHLTERVAEVLEDEAL